MEACTENALCERAGKERSASAEPFQGQALRAQNLSQFLTWPLLLLGWGPLGMWATRLCAASAQSGHANR